MDTIFAVSSGRPPAAIGVVRISGPAALTAARSIAGTLPPPRRAGLRQLRSRAGSVLDRALVLVFPGPATATGEDLVELHCHGGRAVLAAVEHALAAEPGLRPAVAGEFTRRALLAGRIDLAEAQGLADLLAAETELQRVAALDAAEGRVSRSIRHWMERAAGLSARAEAVLDFADEDDVSDDPRAVRAIAEGMVALAGEIDLVLASPAVDRLRDGLRVVLAGPPNSGKSTLLNLLVEREAAIVSPIAGTTRDRVEVAVQRDGYPFILVDTAGLADDTADPIEAIGIERAREAMTRSDLLVWLGDADPPSGNVLWVHARADVQGREVMPAGKAAAVRADDHRSVNRVWDQIVGMIKALVPTGDQLGLREQQRLVCADVSGMLATEWDDLLIGAELLRGAHGQLAGLLGYNANEAMLDALFGEFCIGK